MFDKYYENKNLNVEEKDILDLKKVFNREFTKGYIFKENHKEIVNTYRPNNIGVKIGEVIGVNANKVSIKLTSDLYQGDGIRIVNSKEDVETLRKFIKKNGGDLKIISKIESQRKSYSSTTSPTFRILPESIPRSDSSKFLRIQQITCIDTQR